MTKAEVLARLDEIGLRFVAAGPTEDGRAFYERGIALGLAQSLVAMVPDAQLAEMVRLVQEAAIPPRARPQ